MCYWTITGRYALSSSGRWKTSRWIVVYCVDVIWSFGPSSRFGRERRVTGGGGENVTFKICICIWYTHIHTHRQTVAHALQGLEKETSMGWLGGWWENAVNGGRRIKRAATPLYMFSGLERVRVWCRGASRRARGRDCEKERKNSAARVCYIDLFCACARQRFLSFCVPRPRFPRWALGVALTTAAATRWCMWVATAATHESIKHH
jgi:hypothetical protein